MAISGTGSTEGPGLRSSVKVVGSMEIFHLRDTLGMCPICFTEGDIMQFTEALMI